MDTLYSIHDFVFNTYSYISKNKLLELIKKYPSMFLHSRSLVYCPIKGMYGCLTISDNEQMLFNSLRYSISRIDWQMSSIPMSFQIEYISLDNDNLTQFTNQYLLQDILNLITNNEMFDIYYSQFSINDYIDLFQNNDFHIIQRLIDVNPVKLLSRERL